MEKHRIRVRSAAVHGPAQGGAARVRPLRRNPEGTRRRILEAATEEFARGGLAGARVDSIARRAEVNERMLYYYFGNKEGVFRAVLEHAYLQLVEAERALALDVLAPDAAMRALIEFMWRYYVDHPELITLVNSENLHEARHLKESPRAGELLSPTVDMIARVLQRGEAQGVFRRGVDPVQMYVSIASLGYFHLSNRHTLAAVLGIEPTEPVMLDAHLRHNTELIMTFLRAPGAVR